jgi:hypothetical protein
LKALSAVLLFTFASCAASTGTGSAPVSPTPAPSSPQAPAEQDPARLAADLQRATVSSSARRISFGWSLDEAGAGFRGSGVGRYTAPTRFRLDLFGPRGESYLAAALVDGESRVPAAVEQRFRLPSPALLWAAAGVFVPPADARLVSGRTENGTTTLRYEIADGTLEFRARDAALLSVRRLRGGGVQESVDLERAADGSIRQARYRDWPAFRTLTLTLESSSDVPAFTNDIWTPPGTDR